MQDLPHKKAEKESNPRRHLTTVETEEEEEDEDEGVVVKGFPLKPTKFRGLKSKQVLIKSW